MISNFLVFDMVRFFDYVIISPSRSARCETKKSPAMRVRVEGYTKKNSERDTIKVF